MRMIGTSEQQFANHCMNMVKGQCFVSKALRAPCFRSFINRRLKALGQSSLRVDWLIVSETHCTEHGDIKQRLSGINLSSYSM